MKWGGRIPFSQSFSFVSTLSMCIIYICIYKSIGKHEMYTPLMANSRIWLSHTFWAIV